MPNIKSAKKRVQKSEEQRLLNRQHKSRMRTCEKKLRSFVTEGTVDNIDALLSEYQSIVDRAVKKNIIHKNTAGRKKSQLTLLVKKLKGELNPSLSTVQDPKESLVEA